MGGGGSGHCSGGSRPGNVCVLGVMLIALVNGVFTMDNGDDPQNSELGHKHKYRVKILKLAV